MPRPLSAGDIERASALFAGAYPHRAHEPRGWTLPAEPNDRSRWVVPASPRADSSGRRPSAGAEIAAYLALWPVQPRRFRIDLVVAPALRRRGLGATLLVFLLAEARLRSAVSLQARPYADDAAAMRFVRRHGFRETMRMVGLALDDVAAIELEPIDDVRRRLRARGLRVTTLAAELDAGEDAWTKLRDANHGAQPGWPDPDPNPDGTPHPPEPVNVFLARTAEFGLIADACFIAAAGPQYVAYSALTALDLPDGTVGSGGTAVRPAYRGLGVATALKALTLHWARDHGVRRVRTASGNPAMVRVNEKFGFHRTYVEVRLVRRFDGAPDAEDVSR